MPITSRAKVWLYSGDKAAWHFLLRCEKPKGSNTDRQSRLPLRLIAGNNPSHRGFLTFLSPFSNVRLTVDRRSDVHSFKTHRLVDHQPCVQPSLCLVLRTEHAVHGREHGAGDGRDGRG